LLNEALVVCVRGIISFFTLLIFARILGKQQIGEITFFDYVLGITIGSFGASLTADLSSAAWPHFIGLLTWVILGIMLQYVSLKAKKLSDYINDEPVIVIHDGMIMGDNLKRIKYTLSDLLSQLRLKDIFDISEVKFGIIEANGHLSVIKKLEFRDLLDSLHFPIDNETLNNDVIFNGIIIEDNLEKLSLDHQWLIDQLERSDINNPRLIFYAYQDAKENLKIDTYKDKVISKCDIFNDKIW
jgi:uncharacterized membrane protein YcaP (DUF421 family)